MPDQSFLKISSAFSGTYDLERELGGGGMSRVYLARDPQLGREIVVKTLPADLLGPDAVERFKREIRTAARLQHPNIVPLLAAGEAEGIPYYTMPWVEGASLRERIQRGPVPAPEAIGILRDMARALAAAHAKGVIHRDIKPENVLLSQGAALITDFGVARALSAATDAAATQFQTRTGTSVGTPAYMAPEQFAADPNIDHRADIYAWGIVAYELLSGHHPFAGASGSALLKAHLSTVPPSLNTVAGVPAALAVTIDRALAKEMQERPASAEELVAVLEAPVVAAPGHRRRVSRSMLVAAMAVVAIIGGGAVALRMRGTPSDERTIAIAPFRVGGAAAQVHYLREGLGDLMTPQLQAIPGVSTPTMRVMLAQWRSVGGSVDADLADDAARNAAAKAGAGQLILGEIVGSATEVTINAQLLRVSDGKVLAPAQVKGSPDSVAALAARLVASLLSVRDGATVERLKSVLSANPEAITPFLAGEQAYRRGRYIEAEKHFLDAMGHDSTFALSALRISLAQGWTPSADIPGDWLGIAWRNKSRLSGSDLALLDALTGPTYPQPLPRRANERMVWDAAVKGNTAELWYNAGDILVHRNTLSGDSTYARKALEAFRRAEALDSSFAPALEHQAMLYAMSRDSVSERAAYDRQRMLDSTGDFFQFTDALYRFMHTPTPELMEYAHAHAARPGFSDVFRFAAASTGFEFMPFTMSSERLAAGDSLVNLARPTSSTDISAVLSGGAYWINTGRPRPFQAGPGRDSLLVTSLVNVLAGVIWDGDSSAAARSAKNLKQWADTTRQTEYSALVSDAWFALGTYALAHSDTATAERARAAIHALTLPATEPWLADSRGIHEKLLGAQLAVARKQPDARNRLIELDSLLIDVPANRNHIVNPGNIVVSHLWEALGDDRRAFAAIGRYHAWLAGDAFSSERIRTRARLAERLGLRNEATAALSRFVAVRRFANAPYQAEVTAARARLARLQGSQSGR